MVYSSCYVEPSHALGQRLERPLSTQQLPTAQQLQLAQVPAFDQQMYECLVNIYIHLI